MWSNKKLIFVISGPSGSGKTTLINALLSDAQIKKGFTRAISFTTRPKRQGEINGRDYFFISKKEFEKKLKEKKILEWTKFLDYYYGTPLSYFQRLLKRKKHILMCLDERGALKIKETFPQKTVTIFILPPTVGVLQQRIKKREKRCDRRQLKERIALAKQQLKLAKAYDYRLVNRDFGYSVEQLKKIILKEIEKDGTRTFRKNTG